MHADSLPCIKRVKRENPCVAKRAKSSYTTLGKSLVKSWNCHPHNNILNKISSTMASREDKQSELPSQMDTSQNCIPQTQFSERPSLEEIRAQMEEFASERDWNQFHTPRNILLALVGEVGELSEIFQWRGEVAPGLPGWSAGDRTHLEHELADVLLYLVRLAHVSGVDLTAAAVRKMAHNAAKYPAERVRGDSRKYDEYAEYTRERQTPDGEESS